MMLNAGVVKRRARDFMRHADGPLGVLLVLVATCGLGWSVRTWQDRDEINRIDSRVYSVQASMAKLCTDRVADLTKAYDQRQAAVNTVIAAQTARIEDQSARIAEQSKLIADLSRQLDHVGKTTAEIRQRQTINAARNAVVAKEAARTAAKEAAQETVEKTNEQARNLIDRAVKRPQK